MEFDWMFTRLLVTIFTLIILSKFAQAENLSGFDAVEALVGQSIKMKNADGTSVYTFDSKFEFHMKRAAPFNDLIKGRMVQGNGRNQLCFGFGGAAENFCAQVDLENNQLTFIERGAKKTIGKLAAADKTKKQTNEESDALFCNSFDAMIDASKAGSFDMLKTKQIKPMPAMYRDYKKAFGSSLKLGMCTILERGVTSSKLSCYIAKKNYFDALEYQASRCLKGKLKSQTLAKDQFTEPAQGIEKIAYFDYGGIANMTIEGGRKRQCDEDDEEKDHCDFYEGVWVEVFAERK
jgi:hypothetical protein